MTHNEPPSHLISEADQQWQHAQKHLDQQIEYVTGIQDKLAEFVGGNTDASVIYDYMKDYIIRAEITFGAVGHLSTVCMAAAAITRLVRAPRTENPLAQLDFTPQQGEDHDDQH